MKKCNCKSTRFSVRQQVSVKFLLDGDLNIVGNEVINPKHIGGIIVCEECGKQYTEGAFKELEDIK